MKKLLIALFTTCLLTTSCFDLINFKKHELSGVSGQRTKIIVGPGPKRLTDALSRTLVENDKKFIEAYMRACRPEPDISQKAEVMFAAGVPFIAAGVKVLFDLAVEDYKRDLERLKKAAQRTYNAKAILTAEEMRECQCAILIRYKDAPGSKSKNADPVCGKLGLIAITKIDKHKAEKAEAFWIEPVYIKACDAMAVTKDGQTPKIDLSIGLAFKSVGHRQDSGLPELFTLGEDAISVKNVELGTNKPFDCSDDCPQSGLFLYPQKENDSVVSVSMSIVESGHVGIDFDQRLAEAKAIKEALGPAIEASLKELLKE